MVHQVLKSTYELYESSAVHNFNERNKEAQSSDGGCHANGLLPMHHNNQPTLVALRQSSKELKEKLAYKNLLLCSLFLCHDVYRAQVETIIS